VITSRLTDDDRAAGLVRERVHWSIVLTVRQAPRPAGQVRGPFAGEISQQADLGTVVDLLVDVR
jgi:hypothetical protein